MSKQHVSEVQIIGKELREDMRRGNFIEFAREDTIYY
jgi:hypothetical protein